MNKKNIVRISGTLIICIITIIIDWIKWDISEQFLMNRLFNLLANGLIVIIIAYMLIWTTIYIYKEYKKNILVSLIPAVILLFTILLHIFFPYTNSYVKANYLISKRSLAKIVEMFEQGEMQYYQIGEDKYILPKGLRFISHTGKVYVQTDSLTNKFLFYVKCGTRRSSGIIYVSNESEIKEGDFGRQYTHIKLLDEHWYAVTMQWLE